MMEKRRRKSDERAVPLYFIGIFRGKGRRMYGPFLFCFLLFFFVFSREIERESERTTFILFNLI